MNLKCKLLGHNIPIVLAKKVVVTRESGWFICDRCNKMKWVHYHDYEGYYVE